MKTIALLIALSITLVGCGGLSSQPAAKTSGVSQSEAIELQQLLELAHSSTSPQKEHYYLQAAERLSLQGEDDWARNLLKSIDSTLLSTDDFILYSLLFSAIAMEDDAYFLAQRILTSPRLEQQLPVIDTETAQVLRERRADLFALLGESTASVKERMQLGQLLPSELFHTGNQNAIWQTLMTLPKSQLQHLSQTEVNPLLKGWYSLAALSKDNQTNLERQLQLVDQWIALWPEHPASLNLPNDLQLLRQLIRERPTQVALLLPQQGKLAKAGNAIRNGFLAAYYQATKEQSFVPELLFYDTSEGSIYQHYNQAVSEGAQLIIGPLDKNRVAELSQQLELPVPTLAMNYIATTADTTEKLYQFGLSAEDEARQAARRAWLEGHRQAMILAPQSSWGERSAKAFRDEWETLGGRVSNDSRFLQQKDYLSNVKNALHVSQSHTRARQLRRLFGHSVEFEPRRRQDIDMIFLVANPTQARQLKPTLDFHYASKLPIYATSHIYSGTEDKKNDRDLNNIRFSTLPWVFDQNSPEKLAIVTHANSTPSYGNLYALGVDAYRLYPRLRQLIQVPEARLYGATGALRLLANRKIEREQTWAQMRGGIARPLPTVVSDNYIE